MTQTDVLNILRAAKSKWYETERLSNMLKISRGSVANNLRRLRSDNSVNYKRVVIKGFSKYFYKYKGGDLE